MSYLDSQLRDLIKAGLEKQGWSKLRVDAFSEGEVYTLYNRREEYALYTHDIYDDDFFERDDKAEALIYSMLLGDIVKDFRDDGRKEDTEKLGGLIRYLRNIPQFKCECGGHLQRPDISKWLGKAETWKCIECSAPHYVKGDFVRAYGEMDAE